MPPKPPWLYSSSRRMPFATVSGRADQRRAHLHALAQRVVRRGRAGGPACPRNRSASRSARPCATSRSACSSSSAIWALTTTRQFLRSIVLPFFAAASSAIFHWLGQRLRPARQAGADRQHANAMRAGGDHAERRDGAGHGDLEARVAVRRQVQPRVAHLEPVGLHGDRLFAFQQPHDRIHRLQHARPLRRRARSPACRRPRSARPARSPASRGPRVMWSSCTQRCATRNGW